MAERPEAQPSTSSTDQSYSQESLNNHNQAPFGGLKSPNGNIPMFPAMYPALVPQLDQEQMNRGPAVPILPYMQPFAEFHSNTLIPFTYNIPTTSNCSSEEMREAHGGEQRQQLEQQQHQAGPQRQVVIRRFQIAIQLDLLLILKLAAFVFLFSQDGSRQRLTLLVFFASLVYLYQTGALAPVIRWLSQGMQRAAAPPQPAGAPARANNLPVAGAEGNENIGVAGGQPVRGGENQHVNDGNMAVENEHAGEPEQGEVGNRWWGIVKEIQMIVFGFITSLLPGFHNID